MIPAEDQGDQQVLVPIRVAYCMKLLPNTYRVGGPFIKKLSSISEKVWG